MSWPSDGKPRFVVREIEGFLGTAVGGDSKGFGLSCVVIDRPWNYRLVHEFRYEDTGGGMREKRRAVTRERAATLAARLNAEECAA